MILPPPACFIAGWTACDTGRRWSDWCRSRCAIRRGQLCGGLRMLVPALLTRMSMRPNASTCSIIAATAALSVTSAVERDRLGAAPRAPRPPPPLLRVAPRHDDRAPASARPRAMPSPIPPLPPVTTATLPVRSNSLVSCAVFHLSFSAGRSAVALPDQHQADRAEQRAIFRPLQLLIMKLEAGQGIAPVPCPIHNRPIASAKKPMIESDLAMDFPLLPLSVPDAGQLDGLPLKTNTGDRL